MKRKLAIVFTLTFLLPLTAQANWLEDIFKVSKQIYQVNFDIDGIAKSQLDETIKIKKSNEFQLDEMKRIAGGLIGTHQYGSQYYDPEQLSWGEGSSNWQSVLALSHTGGGSGALGSAMKQLGRDFPINHDLNSPNETENKYYQLQAQTALASRASAQTAFDQLNNEDQTMKQLHNLIDTTKDNKSAVDLNNRLVAENTMVNIQQAKLLAVLVHQIAMDSQEKANRAAENAAFFDIK